ncbi:MAG: hypothetical protein ACRDS0_28985 [Pseudonocardiaceae bacterium]
MRDDGAGREPDRSGTWLVPGLHAMSGAGAPSADRPPGELPPVTLAAGGRSVTPEGLTAEVAALAGLLAEVVMLAAGRAVYPSRLEVLAELATEHDSVRAALAAEATAS